MSVAPLKNRRMQRTPAAKKKTSMMTSEQPSQIDPWPANLKPSDVASAAAVTHTPTIQSGSYISKIQGATSPRSGFASVVANLDQDEEPGGNVEVRRMETKLQRTFGGKIRENGHENDIHRIQNGNTNNSNAG